MSVMPPGRGRWKVYLAQVQPTGGGGLQEIVADLPDARSRRLTQSLNSPAQFIFTLDGSSPSADLIQEINTEVIVQRWSDANARDYTLFRGPITRSQDTLSEQVHTVNFTCHDWLAVVGRRYLTRPIQTSSASPPPDKAIKFVGTDQDQIIGVLFNYLTLNTYFMTGSGVPFNGITPMAVNRVMVNPDGSGNRPLSGKLRDREYAFGKPFIEMIDELGKVIGGFDYAVKYLDLQPQLWIYYPEQGVQRTNIIFEYGSTVAALTRSFNSSAFANYQRVMGAAPDDQSAPLYAEAWTSEAVTGSGVTEVPPGVWMGLETMPDVSIVGTLAERAAYNLEQSRLRTPSFSLQLTPGRFTPDSFNMGDLIRLSLHHGRLSEDHWVRVVGIEYDIGDDDTEDMLVTVTHPVPDFIDRFRTIDHRLAALERTGV